MRFFLPVAKSVIERIAALPPEASRGLIHHFKKNGAERPELLAESIKISADSAHDILQYLAFFKDQNEDLGEDQESIGQKLRIACDEYKIALTNLHTLAEVLHEILPRVKRSQIQQKSESIKRGIGNDLDSVKSIIDLRPVFDAKRQDIEAWVIGVEMRLDYTTPLGEEHALLLDLDDAALTKLTNAIDLIRKKTKILETKARESKLL